jgi:hypothetical protein
MDFGSPNFLASFQRWFSHIAPCPNWAKNAAGLLRLLMLNNAARFE